MCEPALTLNNTYLNRDLVVTSNENHQINILLEFLSQSKIRKNNSTAPAFHSYELTTATSFKFVNTKQLFTLSVNIPLFR